MKLKQYFTPKHIISLLLACGTSVAIVSFTGEIRKFQELGYIGVFLISLLGNATLILPAPGLAFVFLLGGSLPNPLLVGLFAGIGGTLGELTGYLAGYGGSGIITHTKAYNQTKKQIDKYGLWAIFFFALIPNPLFDLAGIVAGAVNIPWWKFLLAAGAGKVIKAIIVAYMGYYSFSL